MSSAWSRQEVEATVRDYFVLASELEDEFNKAAHNRGLRAQLEAHACAVERKHQNISALISWVSLTSADTSRFPTFKRGEQSLQTEPMSRHPNGHSRLSSTLVSIRLCLHQSRWVRKRPTTWFEVYSTTITSTWRRAIDRSGALEKLVRIRTRGCCVKARTAGQKRRAGLQDRGRSRRL